MEIDDAPAVVDLLNLGRLEIGGEAKVAIASVAAALTTAVTVRVGLTAASRSKRPLLHLMQPSVSKQIFRVLLVEAAPSVVGGLRLATSTALILVTVAEMFIGTEHGIGKVVVDKWYTDDRAGQYGAIVAIGIVGFLMNLALALPLSIGGLRSREAERKHTW